MECNKEEAIRARGIAENKMQNKDFAGARKIAVRAQQLFPELDNISQMLTVCEVHCSAELKVHGETDWYGVLQVEPTADESLIKKQYRKLALLLHPDKNKFPGAEAAFKLIGEAHMLLSDKGKRSIHDLKRGTRTGFPQSRASFAKKQPGFNVPNATIVRPNGTNQQQAAGGQTFWTVCPDCGMRYQYYRSILNRALRCQHCLKPFIAYDLNAQPVPPGVNSKQSGIPTSHKSNFGNKPSNMGFQGNVAGRPMAPENMGFQGNVAGRSMAPPSSSRPRGNEAVGTSASNAKDDKVNDESTGNEMKFEKVELNQPKNREPAGKPPAGNTSRKKERNMVVESSNSEESTDSEDVDIEEVEHTAGQKNGATGTNPRRSTRQRQNVRYKEESDDDDSHAADNNADTDENEDDDDFDVEDDKGFVKPPSPKRLKKSGTTSNTTDQCGKVFCEQDHNGVKGQSSGVKHAQVKVSDGDVHVHKNEMHKEADRAEKKEDILKNGTRSSVDDFSSKSLSDMDNFSYPDPEFHDFDKDRGVSKFAMDQIWAVYDDLDGMPRFYARINSICLRGFRIRFTWLEHSPNGEAEVAWSHEELPVACGSYRLGKPECSQDLKIFSHLMSWEKGSRRNTYDIYPKKGEVWALFKGWNIRWSSDAGNHRVYQYEVVEVLSDYAVGTDIDVVHLVKIKGFVGLFIRAIDNGTAPLRVPHSEILRFSHRIPSYRMTGNEMEGIPEGCLELDSASLPDNFGDIAPSISLKSVTLRVEKLANGCAINGGNLAGLSSKRNTDLDNNTKVNTSKGFLPKQVNEVDMMGHAQESSNKAAAAKASSCKENEPMEYKHQDNQKINTITQDVSDEAAAREQDASSYVSNPLCFEYPESEFYTFEEERSVDKFQCGQIWALYSDLDKYPKYYGLIKKVEVEMSKVQLAWLECSPAREVEKRWLEEELPICCGRFKVTRDLVQIVSADTFSHLVQAKPARRKDQYDIYPRTGDVWAIYKNWQVGWKCSDLESCKYDAVEVLKDTGSGIEVQLLVKVDGYQAVFKPERKNGALTKILVDEYLQFSHQIPAFKLTEEAGGKLRGFWELDPASVPDVLLFGDWRRC